MPAVDDEYLVVSLCFKFAYFSKTYTQVSISYNGYVCMGDNTLCGKISTPSSNDILVGLNYDLDTSRIGSGQIYYQVLSSESVDFLLAKDYINLLDSIFIHMNVFMITYDNVLPFHKASSSKTTFKIFLLSDNFKSYVIFKYTSCPSDLSVLAKSGLNYENLGKFKEIIIEDGQQCNSSNVLKAGLWVTEVTQPSLGNFKKLFFCRFLILRH
jgi:hypothetical protein